MMCSSRSHQMKSWSLWKPSRKLRKSTVSRSTTRRHLFLRSEKRIRTKDDFHTGKNTWARYLKQIIQCHVRENGQQCKFGTYCSMIITLLWSSNHLKGCARQPVSLLSVTNMDSKMFHIEMQMWPSKNSKESIFQQIVWHPGCPCLTESHKLTTVKYNSN